MRRMAYIYMGKMDNFRVPKQHFNQVTYKKFDHLT
jgi:hypothetical protein